MERMINMILFRIIPANEYMGISQCHFDLFWGIPYQSQIFDYKLKPFSWNSYFKIICRSY